MALGMAAKANGFMILPERQQKIIDAGIPLFQIRRNGLSINGYKDFGFWSVYANNQINSRTQQFEHVINWTMGQGAYLEFRGDKNGICIGYLPDDEPMHNRINLSGIIDTRLYQIERYHTKDGMVSGTAITRELEVLRDYLHDYKLILSKNNEVITRSDRREDLMEKYNEYLAKDIEVQIIFTKREPFEKLIKIHSSNWFNTPEFQGPHREKINALISDLRRSEVPDVATVALNLADQIKNMTSEQKAIIRDLLLDIASPAQTTRETSGGVDVAGLTYEDLKKHARGIGIDPGNKKKEVIIEMITAKAIQDATTAKSTGYADETVKDTFNDDDESGEVIT
jgi:hypothetical protein